MTKFSIIIPVYNVEKYLDNCLNSIISQSYDNYEVIIVNDGSTDGSQVIIDKYVKKDKRFKSFVKENGGLSDARNYGIKKVTGDYFFLIDSDDTINEDLLKETNDIVSKVDIDLLRFGIKKVMPDGTTDTDTCKLMSNEMGSRAFVNLVKNPLFVTACSYVYNTKFWKRNNFEFSYGRIHEDFGLIPYVLIKAESFTVIDYIGYNYLIRDNSITGDKSEEKMIKKNGDCLYFFDLHKERINNETKLDDSVKKIYMSFVANSLINRCSLLDGKVLKAYLYELKARYVGDYLLSDTLGRKFKKFLFKRMPFFYVKHCIK